MGQLAATCSHWRFVSMAIIPMQDGLGGVCVVTVAYFIVYYAFMTQQIMGKSYQNSRHAAEFELGKMTDRTFLNALEQVVPFTLLLWLHALMVDAWVSVVLGWIAVVARLLFPVLWSLDGQWNAKVE